MQRRFLVRARNLAAFRQALVSRALAGAPLDARRRVVIVPTRAAGALLRSTLEQSVMAEARAGVVCPDFLTRDEWLARLAAALRPAARWLGRLERMVVLERAARDTLARRRDVTPPFDLRPGLVDAMLEFHDEIARRHRRVRTFARAVFDELRVERGTDRGSDSLINQTRFLGFTFLAYQRHVRVDDGVDEHELKRRLLEEQPVLPFDEVIVAVADHPADPRGLWPSDFDLIGRLRHLSAVHVVMTDEAHDAGFRERVEHELPGIEEVRAPDVARAPVLVTVASDDTGDAGVPIAISRDREEELRTVARHIRARATDDGVLAHATAVLFHRPLPYLYLAQQVLTDARVAYQTAHALPLAAEPYAAWLDLAMTAIRADGSREAILALLRSPLGRFEVDGAPVSPREVQALDAVLSDRRATGAAGSFPAEVDAWAAGAHRRVGVAESARRAALAAAGAAVTLRGIATAPARSAHVRALGAFLRDHERADVDAGAQHDRYRRARAGVLAVLDELAEAFERRDDGPVAAGAAASAIYHALEARTFVPLRALEGVQLVDAASARFGEFDDVFLVGLVDTDWADRPRRNFFYSSGLLRALGWPQDVDQTRAQQAAFRDVLSLARNRTRLSAFQLDGDAIVSPSTMIEAARGFPVATEVVPDEGPIFADETLTASTLPEQPDPDTSAWLDARVGRPDLETRAYSGYIAPLPADRYSVSRVDRYVTCPFKYFAERILRLPEERDDEAGLTPLERGTFLHLLLERFYARWQEGGHGAVTAANMPEAHALFTSLADEQLAALSGTDRLVERLRIVGSIVAPGVADRVFELEAAASADVVERWLEIPIEGEFEFPARNGLTRRGVAIRGKADRVDVLADGSLRVIDYKLGRMPDLASSIQLAVYAHCVQQVARRRDGHMHPVSQASYLAFGDDRRFDGRLADTPAEVDMAVQARASAFSAVIDRIESGEFPPQPRRTSECQWCSVAAVCRKEYRVEDDDDAAAEPV